MGAARRPGPPGSVAGQRAPVIEALRPSRRGTGHVADRWARARCADESASGTRLFVIVWRRPLGGSGLYTTADRLCIERCCGRASTNSMHVDRAGPADSLDARGGRVVDRKFHRCGRLPEQRRFGAAGSRTRPDSTAARSGAPPDGGCGFQRMSAPAARRDPNRAGRARGRGGGDPEDGRIVGQSDKLLPSVSFDCLLPCRQRQAKLPTGAHIY